MYRFILTIWICCTAAEALAQSSIHYLQSADDPPGSVGRTLVQHRESLQGYVQPVEVQVPDFATIAVADGGSFEPIQSRIKVGLMVGQIYRLKVTDIPNQPGIEVYPTIEIINRLYPPEGLAERFPIPVQLTQRDLEHAIAGRLVVRVIYVENPDRPFPDSGDPAEPRITHALPDEDPLRVADELGRPMAILRIGSRVPDQNGLDDAFCFGSPPVTILTGNDRSIVSPDAPPHLPSQFGPVSPTVEEIPGVSLESTGIQKQITNPETSSSEGVLLEPSRAAGENVE